MTVATVYARAVVGVDAPLVYVETHLASGLPAFNLVGLPETAVRESKDRVRSAIVNSGFEFPTRRITVNLAPGDLPKHGTRFDLAIALGILAASNQIPRDSLARSECVAELALSGALRPVSGILPGALAALEAGRSLLTARGDDVEAALVTALEVHAADSLQAACAHLDRSIPISKTSSPISSAGVHITSSDLVEIHGQYQGKRALEVAASGGHNLLMIGPPGTGKTMLAMRLPSLLPPLNDAEAFESAALMSISHQGFDIKRWRVRPFRSPHHSSSAAALVGGGSLPRPGEISLAHHGILFLDELPEFERRVLEMLREPMETGNVTISRAARSADFPAAFQLVAAMNPCPCGYHGDPSGRCACTNERIERYRHRISGPLIDRIDIHIEIARQRDWLDHTQNTDCESSETVKLRVTEARERQIHRQNKLNHFLNTNELRHVAPLNADAQMFMRDAFERFNLSPRAYNRMVKLARTIADLALADNVELPHLHEALNLRCLDRVPQNTV